MKSLLLIGALTVAPAADPPSQAPRSVTETLASFRLPEGLVIEAVAAEPLTADPVAITFDETGRMYAVEYADYPNGPGEGKPPLSRIRWFEDLDGDGIMDRSHVFADGLSFAQGLLAWKGGLLVTNAPDVLFLKDTDGDGKADVREKLFTGFKPGNPQLRTAHPRWGLDNWIYLTNGLSGGEVARAGKPDEKVSINRLDFRFDPRTLAFEPATGLGQFGSTFDDWGHRFYCSNRNPTMMTLLPHRAVVRNPYALITKAYEDVAISGGAAKVYPAVETATTAFSHSGTHTAACGVTVYRGDLLGPGFSNDVFVCEPTGHLVTRSHLSPHGVSFRAERARPKIDFLTSDDLWFRPVCLSNGPDGALYVVDMYRSVIEHPQYMSRLPKEYVAKLDLRAGDDRGRIYRIRPRDAKPRPYVPPTSPEDLVALLSDPNGWRRQVGQRLLVERQMTEAAPALEQLFETSDNPLARLHALWTLEGLDKLTPALIDRALDDPDARLREQGVLLAAGYLKTDPRLLDHLAKLIDSAEPRTRFRIALALGETDGPKAVDSLVRLARRDFADPWTTRAILTSVKDRSGVVLAALVADPEFAAAGTRERIDLVMSLASIAGARGDGDELAGLLRTIASTGTSGSWWRTAALTGLAQGLPRHRGSLGRTSLAKLLASPPKELAPSVDAVGALLDRTTSLAADGNLPVADRVAAIGLLGHRGFADSADVFPKLLDPTEPSAVQLACVAALRITNDDGAGPILLERWNSFGPNVRAAALDLLLRKASTTVLLLEAMRDNAIGSSVISLDQRTRLLGNRDERIRTLATGLFGAPVSADRRAVVDKYKNAVEAPGDVANGQRVFKKTCSTCHRINGEGHVVGPDISDVRNKTRESLLYDILDPNRAVEPRFTDYVVATDDGRILNGLLVNETADAIVLRRAEGKEDVIPRSEIETIRVSGKSVMPEGVEKDLSVDQMADLLAFLKAQK